MKEYKAPLDKPPFDLADGRMVEPGTRIRLSDEEALEPHNAAHLTEGRLLPVSEKGERITERAERRTEREARKQEEAS